VSGVIRSRSESNLCLTCKDYRSPNGPLQVEGAIALTDASGKQWILSASPRSSCAAAAPARTVPFATARTRRSASRTQPAQSLLRRSFRNQFDPGDLYPVSNRILPIAPVRSLYACAVASPCNASSDRSDGVESQIDDSVLAAACIACKRGSAQTTAARTHLCPHIHAPGGDCCPCATVCACTP